MYAGCKPIRAMCSEEGEWRADSGSLGNAAEVAATFQQAAELTK